ncbi:MAG: nickel-dependent hydrogenase large subunit [Planctomycetes bacterium]|nr:nickel-dependent hydrogenase large subunit [Planctomycetota bacterium]
MATTKIPIGPYHPLLEEPEYFVLEVEGETVRDIRVTLGGNHRGIEKISEDKTYDQIPFLVERVCGICSASHPIAFVQAAEEIGGVEVPERALYLRTIIAELERLHSHLLWVGLAGHFIGYNTVFMWAWKYREPVLDICELVTGNRLNYAMMKIGGVRRDIPKAHFGKIREILDGLAPKLDMLKGAVVDDPVLHARLKGIGILSPEDVHRFGALGPTARGSGVAIDVRRDDPYAAYDRVEWDVISADSCDVFARAVVRVLECIESVRIIRQCLDRMPEGPIDAGVDALPAGEGIGHAEAPRGETFHYVRSDGTNRPLRHKIRAPTFQNYQTYRAMVVGQTVSDAALATASVDPCYSCTERFAVVDRASGRRLGGWREILRENREKTEAIVGERRMGR